MRGTQDSHSGQGPPAALTSVDGSITSSSAIALLAMAKPLVVAFNSNGWWVSTFLRCS